ncbi:hypothetical protein Tsubulata_016091 [Turnera subulata]|uniref:MADS-box domain-containing protein n=1 Tax=Turnera subulata TaxID=218843 RepID=A0A9Q0J6W9_9ROSI|nr:hypothetical protein Tsubulata_016091 [Turnera subulata]
MQRSNCLKPDSFIKRRETLLRKAEELAAVTGASVGIVCYDVDGELHYWPANKEAVANIFSQATSYSYVKKKDLCGFLEAKKKKLEEQRLKAIKHKFDRLTASFSDSIDRELLPENSLVELASSCETTLKSLSDRIKFLREQKLKETAAAKVEVYHQKLLYVSRNLESTQPCSFTTLPNSDKKAIHSLFSNLIGGDESMGCGTNYVGSSSNSNNALDGGMCNWAPNNFLMGLENTTGSDSDHLISDMINSYTGSIGTNNNIVPYNNSYPSMESGNTITGDMGLISTSVWSPDSVLDMTSNSNNSSSNTSSGFGNTITGDMGLISTSVWSPDSVLDMTNSSNTNSGFGNTIAADMGLISTSVWSPDSVKDMASNSSSNTNLGVVNCLDDLMGNKNSAQAISMPYQWLANHNAAIPHSDQ